MLKYCDFKFELGYSQLFCPLLQKLCEPHEATVSQQSYQINTSILNNLKIIDGF